MPDLWGDQIQNRIEYKGYTISLVNGSLINEIAISETGRDNWDVLSYVPDEPQAKLDAVRMAKKEIDKRVGMSHADFSTLTDMGAI